MAEAHPVKALASGIEAVLSHSDSGAGIECKKIAFLNAHADLKNHVDDRGVLDVLHCEQPDRVKFLDLQQAGHNVQPCLDKNTPDFDACLIIAGKFKVLNEQMVSKAQQITRTGGVILVAGAKNIGIASLKKRILSQTAGLESFAKYHSQVFSFPNNSEQTGGLEKTPLSQTVAGNRKYQTAPGLFSADTIDRGSEMLAEYFDETISGSVADLGAGWGYLGCELRARSSNITALDFFEAEWHGIEATKLNFKNNRPANSSTKAGFFWHDVVHENIVGNYDWVIMNPPFHRDSKTTPQLGRIFIIKAAGILRPGGKLLMVANRHLGYERALAEAYSNFTVLSAGNGYKVFQALK